MLPSVLKLGNIAVSMSFVTNSFKCNFLLALGCLDVNSQKVFHSVVTSSNMIFLELFLRSAMSQLFSLHHSELQVF